jgi:transposase
MERYIGIDVHLQSCTLSVMGPSGKRITRSVVETRGQALIQAVKTVQGRKYICIEEGTQSEWLYGLLEPHVEDIAVIVPPATRGNKSDARDADSLAETARLGRADKRVFKAPRAFAGLRDAARAYQMIGKDVVRAKNRLKSIFRSRGIAATSEVYQEGKRAPWLGQLPQSRRRLAEILAAELDTLMPLRNQAEQWLDEEAKLHSAVRRLTTVPGLGDVRAALVAAIVVTPDRFRTSRQFWSYCGLAVVTRSSADWRRHNRKWVRTEMAQSRGLNRDRQPVLKSIFKGAATTVISRMSTHPLHHDYQRMLVAGTKPNLAKLTLARRIAASCLAIWKKQEDYDPSKQRARPTPAA